MLKNSENIKKINHLKNLNEEKLRKIIHENNLEIYKKIDDRYTIYEGEKDYYFVDKYWPEITKKTKKECENCENEIEIYAIGFMPIVLDIQKYRTKDKWGYIGDMNFWQYPNITEKIFYDKHVIKNKINLNNKTVTVFLPMPWATFIDLGKINKIYIGMLESRIKSALKILNDNGYKVKIVTVCQHIYWENLIKIFKKLNISDLYLSHKTKSVNSIEGINIHGWMIFAVNYEDKTRSKYLSRLKIENKKYKASFIGAYREDYPNDTRKKLCYLENIPAFKIGLNKEWHFENTVYQHQIKYTEQTEDELKSISNQFEIYNKVLSDSIFSICPDGTGPNTVRIWESMAVGAIPIVISDEFEFPFKQFGENFMLRIKSSEIEKIENIINTMNIYNIKEMQKNCIMIYDKLNKLKVNE